MLPRGDSPAASAHYARPVTRRNAALDAALGVLAFALSVGVLAAEGFGTPDAHVRRLDALGVLLAAATALPLAARRVAPLTVGLVTIAASAGLYRLGYAFDLPLGPAVAVYTIGLTCGGDPRAARRRLAVLVTVAFAPVVAAAYAARGEDVGAILVPELVGLLAASAALGLAGDRTRLRRERIAGLEERARRAEREAERERRLAAAEERTRIARELHDSAGHAINVILVQAGAARLLHERDPASSLRAIATIEDVARDTIGEIDKLVRALREDSGAPAAPPPDASALADLVRQHRESGLTVDADLAVPEEAVPRSVAWAAYRILQEALTNAARHGRGTASVAARYAGGAVEITVTNPVLPGRAGPARASPDVVSAAGAPDTTAGGGHGVVGMRERATLLGGTLSTAVEQGVFRLHASLPVGRSPAGHAPDTSATGGASSGDGRTARGEAA
jgi:signal transduction histidine kinase